MADVAALDGGQAGGENKQKKYPEYPVNPV
jgi:hypothetical protein